jgi:hypothetical protein
MRKTTPHDRQLGFDAFLLDADRTNHTRKMDQESAHLPMAGEVGEADSHDGCAHDHDRHDRCRA